MKYLRNIKLRYIMTFFEAFIPAYVIERLFWEMRGMNVTMVVLCEMIFAVVVVLIEIPTGIMADRFGRKKMIVIRGFLSIFEFFILLNANNFFMFALAIFLSAIGHGCESGSSNALLYDSLLSAGKQDSFEKVLGKNNVISSVSLSISAILGGCLAGYYGLELNYSLSVVSSIIAFSLSLFLLEPPYQKEEDNDNAIHIMAYFKEGLRFFHNHKVVMGYCLTGAFLAGCINYLDEFWQLLSEKIGVPIILYGLVLTGYCIIKIPGSLLAYKVKAKFDYDKIFQFMIAFYTIGFFIIAFTHTYWCLIPMFFLSMLQGIMDPLIEGCIHHNTESHIRATVDSFVSLIIRAMIITVGFVFSIFANKSIFNGFLVLGILCLGYYVVSIAWNKKNKA